MATWLFSALRLLGLGAGVSTAVGIGEAATGINIPFLGTSRAGFDHAHARRRRRRALTASDKNDIAFMAATLGDTAARKFALIIAARVA